MKEIVVILGASANPERYSYKCMHLLEEKGHQVILVSPREDQIEGRPCVKTLAHVKVRPDTLTMYVNPTLSQGMVAEILALNPKRVIFNPGTENPSLVSTLESKNIFCEEACTLVLLRTQQYDRKV